LGHPGNQNIEMDDRSTPSSSLYDSLVSSISLLAKVIEYLEKEISRQTIETPYEAISKQIKNLVSIESYLSTLSRNVANIDFLSFERQFEDFCSILRKLDGLLVQALSYRNLNTTNNQIFYALENRILQLLRLLKKSKTISVETNLIANEIPAVISEFLMIGSLLKDSKEVLAIKKALEALKFNELYPSTYVALVGPSYIGKTQCACTLAQLGKAVIYVNFSGIADMDSLQVRQNIYDPFVSVSKFVLNCLIRDDNSFKKNGKFDLNATLIFNSKKRLYTLGLLLFFITRRRKLQAPDMSSAWFFEYIKFNRVCVSPLSVANFKQEIKGNIHFLFILILTFYRTRYQHYGLCSVY
jgi:hypothetical protein